MKKKVLFKHKVERVKKIEKNEMGVFSRSNEDAMVIIYYTFDDTKWYSLSLPPTAQQEEVDKAVELLETL